MKGVVTLGETMVALSPTGVGPLRHAPALTMSPAGAESNVAIGVARLGVPARWIGRVGDDEPGRLVTRTLRAEGVDAQVTVDDAATALMLKEQRTSSTTRVTYYRSGSAGSHLSPADVREEAIADADVLHVSGITAAISASARAAVAHAVSLATQAGVTVSLDVNHRARLWSAADATAWLQEVLPAIDILLVGDDEAPLLTDADDDGMLDALVALGPREVLLKRGSRGAVASIAGEVIEAPLYQVAAIDPVGAGDAFAAGYLAARCKGLSAAECVDTAAATGAFAVTVRGDWEGAPEWRELSALRAADGHVQR